MDEKFVELTRRDERAPSMEELAAFRQQLHSEWSV
jgi:hypothetical protein